MGDKWSWQPKDRNPNAWRMIGRGHARTILAGWLRKLVSREQADTPQSPLPSVSSPSVPLFLAAILATSLIQARAWQPVPRLVANLNTMVDGRSSEPMHFRDLDGRLAFSVFDNSPAEGPKFWLSDGTAENTSPAVNPMPGSLVTWNPLNWVKAGGKWFFASPRTDGGMSLWTHQEIGANFALTGELAGFPALPQNLTACGNLLYFTVNHGAPAGTVLWRSDGTGAGTFPLNVASAGSTEPGNGFPAIPLLVPALAGDELWFVADHSRLFRSGGTPETTVEVHYTAQVPAGSIDAIVAGDHGIFFTCHGDARILARTDGTPAGTAKIGGGDGSAPDLWRDPDSLHYWQGALYFNAFTEELRTQLYRSDGSAAGPSVIKVMTPNPTIGLSPPEILGTSSSVMFVEADDGKKGRNLYRTDGTARGTTVIRSMGEGGEGIPAGGSHMIDGRLWFSPFNHGRRALWVSDGTPKGTRLVKSFAGRGPDSEAGIQQIGGAGGVCYLSASDGVHGMELWKSDGTAKGTVMVKDIAVAELGGISEGMDVAVMDGRYYFSAGTRVGESQLWRSDGTAVFRNFGRRAWPYNLSAAAGRLNVFVYDRQAREHAWSSDGTVKGTRKEKPFPSPPREERMAETGGKAFAVINRKLYLLRPGHRGGPLLLDAPGEIPDAYDLDNPLAVLNGRVIFPGSSGGPALWSSDGTPEGTVMVAQMSGFPTYSVPFELTEFEGSIHFLYRVNGGVQLWKSDGSEAGTTMVARSSDGDREWLRMEACGGKLYILGRAMNGELRLFVHDGEGAPVQIKAFCGTTFYSLPYRFQASGELLYFSFDDPVHGVELWRSDGTTDGTTMVKDIHPGTGGGSPHYLVNAGSWTYFVADDHVHGFELWRTDGTAANTTMLADLQPGPLASWPQGLRLVGERLLFSAQSDKGRELWAIDNASAAPAGPSSLAAKAMAIDAGSGDEDPEALLRHAFNVTRPGDTTSMTPGTGTSGYPVIGASGEVLRVEYLRRKDGRLVYTPRYSESLAPGSFRTLTGRITVTDIDAAWQRVVAEHPYDPAATPRVFVRVEVTARQGVGMGGSDP